MLLFMYLRLRKYQLSILNISPHLKMFFLFSCYVEVGEVLVGVVGGSLNLPFPH